MIIPNEIINYIFQNLSGDIIRTKIRLVSSDFTNFNKSLIELIDDDIFKYIFKYLCLDDIKNLMSTNVILFKKIQNIVTKVDLRNTNYKFNIYFWFPKTEVLILNKFINNTNLQLIEPQLKTLNCDLNTTVDGNFLKKCVKLTYLKCGYNQNFDDESLKHINNLKKLECDTNFKFTNHGVSYLSNLEFLDCGWSFDITYACLYYLPNIKLITYSTFLYT